MYSLQHVNVNVFCVSTQFETLYILLNKFLLMQLLHECGINDITKFVHV